MNELQLAEIRESDGTVKKNDTLVQAKTNSKDAVDLFKFIASILIFSMHLNALKDFGEADFVLEILSRWGVPFFFISSSYFLFRKGENGNISRTKLAKYIQRVAQLYLVWFVINLSYTFYKRVYESGYQNLSTWLDLLRKGLFSSTFFGSWFLMSCMFSAWFVWLMSKRLKTGLVILLSFPLYALCILRSVYAGILPAEMTRVLSFFSFPLNIFNGCFYFALGKWIVENEEKLVDRLSYAKCIFMIVLSYTFFCVEIKAAKHLNIYGSNDAGIGLMAVGFFLFVICLKSTLKIRRHRLLRKLSTVIYCIQGDIVCVWRFGLDILHVKSYLLMFGVSSVLLVLACITVVWLQEHTSWKWCKALT